MEKLGRRAYSMREDGNRVSGNRVAVSKSFCMFWALRVGGIMYIAFNVMDFYSSGLNSSSYIVSCTRCVA